KRAYCLKTQPATGETYPKSDLFNKAKRNLTTNVKNTLHGLKVPLSREKPKFSMLDYYLF
ncbi:hypothetical protein V6130_22270, partial [Klebsiella pneumoniae]